jgi:hypothetical protein
MKNDHEFTSQERTDIDAYLMRRTGMSRVEAGALDDHQVAEHVLAINGCAVVSAQIQQEIERIEMADYDVPLCELDAVIFAVFSGAYGEYHRCLKELADAHR